jgi:co-chaperonin GroES (HSP10)
MLKSTDNVRPLRNRVLVKELPWPGTTGGGLFLPDQAKKRDELWRAVVIAVGPGKPAHALLSRALKLLGNAPIEPEKHLPGAAELAEEADAWREAREVVMQDVRDGLACGFGAEVRRGDVVLVSKYIHTKVRIGGEECCMISADDILGVLQDGAEQLRGALLEVLGRLPATPEAAE